MEAKAELSEVYDTLENLVAEMGTVNDKRSATNFTNSKLLADRELMAMYRTEWITGKTIDIIPDDATREWRTFEESAAKDKLEEEEKRIQLKKSFNLVTKWARLFGGGGILISVNDGKAPHEPLEIEKLRKGSLNHIKVFDKTRLRHADVIDNDPMSENFGSPQFYTLHGSAMRIHHTRILRFDGLELPYDEYMRNGYWHDSVMNRVYDSLVNMGIGANSSASMIFEANVDTIAIPGLMNQLSSPKGTEEIKKRFALAKLLKSFNNMLLLDDQEKYDIKNNSFAGLPDLLSKFMTIVAAATDIPATRMLGTAATGFNATGEGDLKNYYDMIASKQPAMFDKNIRIMDSIMAKSLGISEENTDYKWNSLFQMTEMEKAELELKRAQRDQIYIGTVVTEDIVAKQLMEDGTYSAIDEDYIKELEEMNELPEDETGEPSEEEGAEENEGGEGDEDTGGAVSEGDKPDSGGAEEGDPEPDSSDTEAD